MSGITTRSTSTTATRVRSTTRRRSYGGWWEGWFEDARAGLNEPRGYISAYLAKPFLFGRPRFAVTDARLALEFMRRCPATPSPSGAASRPS